MVQPGNPASTASMCLRERPEMDSTSPALSLFDHAREALVQAHKIDEVKDLRDKAHALLLYSRQAKESLDMQNLCAEIKLRAERRAGELLAETTVKGGQRHKLPDETYARRGTLPGGISKVQSHRWQTIAALPEPEFEALVTKGKRGTSELTTASLYREAKQYLHSISKSAIPDHVQDATARYRVIHSEIQDALQYMAPGSIDAILTDPPYGREHLELYEHLGILAATALRPGGSLLVMTGQAYLPEVLMALTPHLRYQWTLAYLLKGRATAVWNRSAHNHWKPILWFAQGTYAGEFQGDVIQGDGPEKDFHDWGQSEAGFRALVKRFTVAGEVILDPFCGGGTTGVAAVSLGRKFLGFDMDPQAVATTLGRLTGVQGVA